jgi:transcriptional regulator with XRE-family HTH domain
MRTSIQRSRDANAFVSTRLRELRKERGMSQPAAAAYLKDFTGYNWSSQSLSRAEICDGPLIKRWNVDDLYALAAAFGVPVTHFLRETTQPVS